jgi:hypothetical protein
MIKHQLTNTNKNATVAKAKKNSRTKHTLSLMAGEEGDCAKEVRRVLVPAAGTTAEKRGRRTSSATVGIFREMGQPDRLHRFRYC